MIRSEKEAFFADPAVQKELKHNGLRVEVDPAGSRQIATSIDLDRTEPPAGGLTVHGPPAAPAERADQAETGRRLKRPNPALRIF